ncbi:MAG: VCBS repeat-containing protein [Planctomycetes bacterium]|nr:VCBS repeat-containing protein [Planctomycetota bacterium]
MGDVDRDGDVDAIFAEAWGLNLLLNDGVGRFTRAPSANLPADAGNATALALQDLDGDGDLDLALGGLGVRIHRNEGSGRFVSVSSGLPAGLPGTRAVAAGDLDGDGDVDLVFASWYQDVVLLNAGSFAFAHGTAPHPASRPVGLPLLQDLDRDGALDLLVVESDVSPPAWSVFRNDGRGGFGLYARNPKPARDPTWPPIRLADVDGDGDPDLLHASRSGSGGPLGLRLHVNDGAAGFTQAPGGMVPHVDLLALAVADLDGDRDLDVVVGEPGRPLECLVNDGSGIFAARAGVVPPEPMFTSALLLADLDLDGDSDLVVGQARPTLLPHPTKLFWNDGNGVFTENSSQLMPGLATATQDVLAGDLDGDGDQDLVLHAWRHEPGDRPLLCFLQTAPGHFTESTGQRVPALSFDLRGVAIADVDEDGDLDLVAQPVAGQTVTLLVNDGRGYFSSVQVAAQRPHSTGGVALGDVDGDGDLDLVTSTSWPRNLHRHLHAPYLALVGRPFVLEIHSMPGYAPGTPLAIPLLGRAGGDLPVPGLGNLGLDPRTLIVLPPASLPPGGGMASVALQIPNLPALAGVPFAAQALMFPGGRTPARFTNMVGTRIWR